MLAAAQAAVVRRYLRQPIGSWAAPGPGLADEDTPLAFDASATVSADARVVTELESRLLGNQNIEGIALRYGFFYGPGTWFNPDGDVARQVRQQQFPIVGNGEGVWSWLHTEDAAIATVAAAERGNPGVYLIANDHPWPVDKRFGSYAADTGARVMTPHGSTAAWRCAVDIEHYRTLLHNEERRLLGIINRK